MKHYKLCLTVIFILIAATNAAFASSAPHAKITRLEILASPDVVIKARAADAISSQTHKKGDIVRFIVAEDVMVDSQRVVPAGAMLEGIVSDVKRSAVWDEDGRLEISFSKLKLQDGRSVSVSGNILLPGKKPNFFVQSSVVGLLVKGDKAAIAKETQFDLLVQKDVLVRQFLSIAPNPIKGEGNPISN